MSDRLTQIIENLSKNPDVDGVFLTGSQTKDNKPYSDIDLVIILRNNHNKLNSLYTWIDGKFADVFFFDQSDIKRMIDKGSMEGNSMDAIFIDWLAKAHVYSDKSGLLNDLKSILVYKSLFIPTSEKQIFLQKVNYNLVANTRYFESKDPLYHEALEMRLLYSVSELISAYFEFRDIPWRGEKMAIKYFKENNEKFYEKFKDFTKASNLNEKFEAYVEMAKLVFTSDYKEWGKDDVIPLSKELSDTNLLTKYWLEITN